eukprot:sb/3472329/
MLSKLSLSFSIFLVLCLSHSLSFPLSLPVSLALSPLSMLLLPLVVTILVVAVSGRDFDRSVETILEREKHQFVDDPEFDHEAFLGKDIADDFDDLTVEQSKAKLAEMLPKVDTDSDGEITQVELEKWISDQIQEYIKRDSKTAFPNDDTDMNGMITWDEYVVWITTG